MISLVFFRPKGGLGNQLCQSNALLALSESSSPIIFTSLRWFRTTHSRKYYYNFGYPEHYEYAAIVNLILLLGRILINNNDIYYSFKPFPFLQICLIDSYCHSLYPISPFIANNVETKPFPFDHLTYCAPRQLFPNTIFLHSRKGDYLIHPNNTIYSLLADSYYERSILALSQSVQIDSIFFFSEDSDELPPFLKFARWNIRTFSRLSPPSTLRLMSSCHHAVIANSTLSFWGARLLDLNPLLDTHVIYPKNWYLDPLLNETFLSDMIPPSWSPN